MKRYTYYGNSHGWPGGWEETDDGKWVKFEDVEKAGAGLAEALEVVLGVLMQDKPNDLLKAGAMAEALVAIHKYEKGE